MIDNTALQAAIAYFEDAVRESDEIIADCSIQLAQQLNEQKGHFGVALKVMRRAEHANELLTCEGCMDYDLIGTEDGCYVRCDECKRLIRTTDYYRRKPEPEGDAR